MRKNTDQKKFEYDRFPRSEGDTTEKWVDCYRYNQPKHVDGVYYKTQIIIFRES